MPYCDNVHVLARDERLCEEGRQKVCNGLRNIGFDVHEEVESCHVFATLGGVINGHSGTVTPTPTRLWNLLAFEYCERHPVSSAFVRSLLGHAMTICVLCRPGMSVFRSHYGFSVKGIGICKLWPSAVQECRIFLGILPLLLGSLRKLWPSWVVCTDASPDGYGIAECEMGIDEVQQIGAWSERWRFKRLPPELWRPRQRALGRDVFSCVETARRPEPPPEPSFEHTVNKDFHEVPFPLLDP